MPCQSHISQWHAKPARKVMVPTFGIISVDLLIPLASSEYCICTHENKYVDGVSGNDVGNEVMGGDVILAANNHVQIHILSFSIFTAYM